MQTIIVCTIFVHSLVLQTLQERAHEGVRVQLKTFVLSMLEQVLDVVDFWVVVRLFRHFPEHFC